MKQNFNPESLDSARNNGEFTSHTGPLRIIDANANRTLEGLRVIEDYVRFVLDDHHLTDVCKHLRHDFVTELQRLPTRELYAARDTTHDVGTHVVTAQEYYRSSTIDVAMANVKRVQQSLRCVEEYSKLFDSEWSYRVEALRYQMYTIEQAIDNTVESRQRLENVRLYVLTNGAGTIHSFRERVEMMIQAEVDVIQLRDKQLDDRELLNRARIIRKLTESTPTLFFVNDRPDLAVLTRADGVHLGQTDMHIKEARRIVGLNQLVGVSTHSIAQVRQAVLDGANYVGVGPVFASTTKEFSDFPGLELLRAVASEITLPAFAIGGICADNLQQVLASGFARIAVSGSIVNAADPLSETTSLRKLLFQCK